MEVRDFVRAAAAEISPEAGDAVFSVSLAWAEGHASSVDTLSRPEQLAKSVRPT